MRKDPSDNVNSSEDFILTVVEGHILAAVMEAFGMSSLDGISHLSPSQKNHKNWSHFRGVNFYYAGCRLSLKGMLTFLSSMLVSRCQHQS